MILRLVISLFLVQTLSSIGMEMPAEVYNSA